MNLEQTSQWRRLAGWAGGGLCFLALLSLLDGIVAGFREPASVIRMLPGMSTEINGELLEEVRGVQDLTYVSDSRDFRLTFATVHKGYFLGADMWRGEITANPRIKPGEYHLTVAPRTSASPRALPAFRILVFPDALSLQRSSKSLIRRYTGLPPWGVAAACLPGILGAFGAVFLLSQKIERLLAREGKAEIYRALRGDGIFEIHFGLGTENGVEPGCQLQVLDPQGRAVGLARVEAASAASAVALVTSDREIRPGFFVSR